MNQKQAFEAVRDFVHARNHNPYPILRLLFEPREAGEAEQVSEVVGYLLDTVDEDGMEALRVGLAANPAMDGGAWTLCERGPVKFNLLSVPWHDIEMPAERVASARAWVYTKAIYDLYEICRAAPRPHSRSHERRESFLHVATKRHCVYDISTIDAVLPPVSSSQVDPDKMHRLMDEWLIMRCVDQPYEGVPSPHAYVRLALAAQLLAQRLEATRPK